MRFMAMILAGGAALALSACGSETSGEFTTEQGEAGEYTIDKDTGETTMTIQGKDGEASLRSGANVPVSLPDGFTLYPGTKVVTNSVVDQPGGQGTLISFEVDAPAEKVAAHYRDAAKAAGYAIEFEINTNGTRTLGGRRASDDASVSVTASGDGPTTGQIILATTKPK